MTNQRRGVLLVLTLAGLALAAALITPLAMLSGTTAVIETHQADALRHRLATDSLVALLPDLLAADARLRRDLDRPNRATVAFDLDGVRIDVLIQDDTAKLPLRTLSESDEPHALRDALTALRASIGLTSSRLQSAVSWSGCFDGLFELPDDRWLFGDDETSTAWAAYLTPLGRRVHLRRAEAAVLEAALRDLRPGLGRKLAKLRDQRPDAGLDELIRDIEAPQDVAKAMRARLTSTTERYSLLVRTRIGRDVRRRFLICDAGDPPGVLLDWEVAP